MYIGYRLLIKHEGEVKEGIVEKIFEEDLDIKLNTGEIIRRKFWEVRSIPNEKKE